MSDKLYLNVGCGKLRYEGAVNIDVVENEYTDVDIVADMCKLPYEDGTVDGIIAHHVVEHLPRSEWTVVMKEFWRVLKPGAKLFVAVPDLRKVISHFLDNYLGQKDYWYQNIYGMDRHPADRHLSGFTEQSLTDLLFDTGFGQLKWNKPLPIEREHNLEVTAIKCELPTLIQEVKNGSIR